MYNRIRKSFSNWKEEITMARNESYKTKQKVLIIGIIKSKKDEFTIKDIYEEIKNEVGLTTIYRLVDKLTNDGILQKSVGKNNEAYYQYLEECDKKDHFYLKCESCKKLIHIDCECMKDLTAHVLKEHNFIPSHDHIIINGLCDKCNKNGVSL